MTAGLKYNNNFNVVLTNNDIAIAFEFILFILAIAQTLPPSQILWRTGHFFFSTEISVFSL